MSYIAQGRLKAHSQGGPGRRDRSFPEPLAHKRGMPSKWRDMSMGSYDQVLEVRDMKPGKIYLEGCQYVNGM